MTFSRRQFVVVTLAGSLLLAVGWLIRRLGRGAALPGDYAVLSGKEAQVATALADAMFPAGNGMPSVQDTQVVTYFDTYLARLHPRSKVWLLLAGIYALEHLPLFLGYWRRASGMSHAQRVAFLEFLRTGPVLLSSLLGGMRTILAMGYWAHPQAQMAIGAYQKCPNWSGTLLDPR